MKLKQLIYIALMWAILLLGSCAMRKNVCRDYKVLYIQDDTIFWITQLDSTYHKHDTIHLDGTTFYVLKVKNH